MWSFELLNYDFRHLFVVLMAAALFSSVVACSEDNSHPPNPGDGRTPQENASGGFIVSQLEDTELKVEECKSSTFSLDNRIKPGDIYESKNLFLSTDNNYYELTEKETIDQVQADAGVIISRIEKTDQAGAKWIGSGCSFQMNADGGSKPQCKTIELAEIPEPNEEEELLSAACLVVANLPEHKEVRKVEKGLYTFANQKSVSAFRVTTESSGMVLCSDGNSDLVEKGYGKKTSVTIVSSEVPETFTKVSCGAPAGIFFYEKIRLNNGTVKSHMSSELVSLDRVTVDLAAEAKAGSRQTKN